jgi:hypothetical protein
MHNKHVSQDLKAQLTGTGSLRRSGTRGTGMRGSGTLDR